MRKSLAAVALAAGFVVAPLAQAAQVTLWDYTVTAAWTAATFTAGNGTQIQTGTEISWGGDNNGATSGVGNLIVGGGERSGIQILNTPTTGVIVTGSLSPQLTNTYGHINNPISGSFATLRTATVQTTLNLTPNMPSGAALPSDTLTFDINFSETENDGSCVVGATSNCDDIFVVTFGSLNKSFVYDGYTYFASILKTSGPLNPLSPSACAEAGAATGCLGFLTREGEQTLVDFGIVITSEAINVPEPGMLSLAGLGLLGVAASRRRRKTA